MHRVLARLKSKIFSVGQPWWLTFFHTSKLLKSHVHSGSAPGLNIDDQLKFSEHISMLF